MSSWFACSPCQICNEESRIICYCSKVFLCEHCLPKHLMFEVSAKHKPMLIENICSTDDSEPKRKNVFDAIVSRLQNELLQIDEFKRITVQTITDYIKTLRKSLADICDNLIKSVEEQCSRADEDIRAALSLSKLSLNVNHPILDLFKFCRSIDEVRQVEVFSRKHIEYDQIDLYKLITLNLRFGLEINKDEGSRVLPSKAPGNPSKNRAAVNRFSTTQSISDSPISATDSMASSKTYYAFTDDLEEREQRYSKIWDYPNFTREQKFFIEMELQERPKPVKETLFSADFSSLGLRIYKCDEFSDAILVASLNSATVESIQISGEKIFPKAAWCVTEDEKLLICGGFDGNPRNSVLLYNLKTMRVEKAANMIFSRCSHGVVSCGKYIYAMGGVSGKMVKECERFSLENKEWKKVGGLIIGREYPGICVHSQTIYLCGGTGIESIETFNPRNFKFTLLSIRLPTPGKCCLFPYDDTIFVLQRNRVFKLEANRKILSQVEDEIEDKSYWSPCEPLVTADYGYFCTENEFYKLSLQIPYTVARLEV
jgi:hypothetical protein